MSLYYIAVHAAVTQFDDVFVADFVQFMVWGEVSLYQFEKILSNVCLYMSTVWRVEPRDVSGSLVLLCWFFSGVCFFAGWYCSLVRWPDLYMLSHTLVCCCQICLYCWKS